MIKEENQKIDDMEEIKEECETGDLNDEADVKAASDEENVSNNREEDDTREEDAPEDKEDENTKYLRLYADFQNFKKRTEKEKSDIYAYANEKIALDMLDVIDNFELALSHKEGVSETFVEGMEKILKQFNGVLEKNGIKEIDALGSEFDPMFHHAVMTEDTDKYESGAVSDVLKKGYVLNGKVIRAAMVKVAN